MFLLLSTLTALLECGPLFLKFCGDICIWQRLALCLAYQFGNNEQEKLKNDPTYQIRPSIKIVISAKAEQMTEFDDSSDINYPLGKLILYDVNDNKRCTQLSQTCIRTHVIDINNKIWYNVHEVKNKTIWNLKLNVIYARDRRLI